MNADGSLDSTELTLAAILEIFGVEAYLDPVPEPVNPGIPNKITSQEVKDAVAALIIAADEFNDLEQT